MENDIILDFTLNYVSGGNLENRNTILNNVK